MPLSTLGLRTARVEAVSVGDLVVDKPPTGRLKAGSRRSGIRLIHACFKKRMPVVGTHLRKGRLDVGACVRFHDWLGIAPAEKTSQEIIERVESLRLFANDGINA